MAEDLQKLGTYESARAAQEADEWARTSRILGTDADKRYRLGERLRLMREARERAGAGCP